MALDHTRWLNARLLHAAGACVYPRVLSLFASCGSARTSPFARIPSFLFRATNKLTRECPVLSLFSNFMINDRYVILRPTYIDGEMTGKEIKFQFLRFLNMGMFLSHRLYHLDSFLINKLFQIRKLKNLTSAAIPKLMIFINLE